MDRSTRTNQGLGTHGFVTTAVGHGVTTHVQLLPHGERVAAVVVAVVVVLITDKGERARENIGEWKQMKNLINILC